MSSKDRCRKTAMLGSVGLWRLYGTWTHVGALALMLSIDQLVNHGSNEDSQWPPTLGPLCAATRRSALSSWGLSPAQKDSIMYDAHTVVLPLAPIWIDTWQAYPQMGQGRGEGARCRGEAAHAQATNWNNGVDERPPCLGFRGGDYWTSRSPFCVRLESAAMGAGGN